MLCVCGHYEDRHGADNRCSVRNCPCQRLKPDGEMVRGTPKNTVRSRSERCSKCGKFVPTGDVCLWCLAVERGEIKRTVRLNTLADKDRVESKNDK